MTSGHLGKSAHSYLSSLLVAVGTLLSPIALDAQVVSFNFSGTVTGAFDTGGLLPPEITAGGTPFSGTLTYNSALPSDTSSDPTQGAYVYPSATGFSMSVTIGSHTFATGSPAPDSHLIIVANGSGGISGTADELYFDGERPTLDGGAVPGSPTTWHMILILDDNSATSLNSKTLPTSVPSLASFPTRADWFMNAKDGIGNNIYELDTHITSITPVPEPASACAVAAGGLALFSAVRRGRKRAR